MPKTYEIETPLKVLMILDSCRKEYLLRTVIIILEKKIFEIIVEMSKTIHSSFLANVKISFGCIFLPPIHYNQIYVIFSCVSSVTLFTSFFNNFTTFHSFRSP